MPTRMFSVASPVLPVSASLEDSSPVSVSLVVLVVPLAELVPASLPQAPKVAHTRARARTTARIFLSFIPNSP